MWIRSQSKRLLINIDVISVHNECDYYLIRGGGYELGRYSTKEKALRVLDGIQNQIEYKNIEVHQMPQDEDA